MLLLVPQFQDRPASSRPALLDKIAQNIVFDAERRATFQNRFDPQLLVDLDDPNQEYIAAANVDVEEAAEKRVLLQEADTWIQRHFTGQQKRTFDLRLAGYSAKEIADRMNTNEKAVRACFHRINRKLELFGEKYK